MAPPSHSHRCRLLLPLLLPLLLQLILQPLPPRLLPLRLLQAAAAAARVLLLWGVPGS